LESEIRSWKARLERALLKVEERERQEPLPRSARAWLPGDGFRLLNLKVWCERYRVPPEFVLEAVLARFSRSRRKDEKSGHVALGLPASMASGISARCAVEEAVVKAFPCGENRKAVEAASTRPAAKISYDDPEGMVRAYSSAMEKRQRARSKKSKRNFRRAWRCE
jgi:hypothetical protein